MNNRVVNLDTQPQRAEPRFGFTHDQSIREALNEHSNTLWALADWHDKCWDATNGEGNGAAARTHLGHSQTLRAIVADLDRMLDDVRELGAAQ